MILGKTEQPARLTWPSWSHKLPHQPPEKPCHSSNWIKILGWHGNMSATSITQLSCSQIHMFFSGSKPLSHQPSFLHFSNLSGLRKPLFSPQSQGTDAEIWVVDVCSCLEPLPMPETPWPQWMLFYVTVSHGWRLVRRRETWKEEMSQSLKST